MARTPSMLALLGLLAVAGYQNRDRIGQMIKDLQQPGTGGASGGTGAKSPLDTVVGGLGDLFGLGDGNRTGGSGGNVLSRGLDDLMDTFRTSGHKDAADSWVTMGVPTRGLRPEEVESAVGADNIAELSKRTGLSRAELLERLATAIPETVDRATPDGSMPHSDDEIRQRLGG